MKVIDRGSKATDTVAVKILSFTSESEGYIASLDYNMIMNRVEAGNFFKVNGAGPVNAVSIGYRISRNYGVSARVMSNSNSPLIKHLEFPGNSITWVIESAEALDEEFKAKIFEDLYNIYCVGAVREVNFGSMHTYGVFNAAKAPMFGGKATVPVIPITEVCVVFNTKTTKKNAGADNVKVAEVKKEEPTFTADQIEKEITAVDIAVELIKLRTESEDGFITFTIPKENHSLYKEAAKGLKRMYQVIMTNDKIIIA